MSQTKCQLFDVSVEGPTALKNGANNATLDGSGNLSISAGNLVLANGSGIDFSANGNATGMTSELLDDYEEGTWTPVLKSGTNTITYTGGNINNTYTKIGNKVTVYFSLDGSLTSGSTGGDFTIEGLPFACGGGAGWRTLGTLVNSWNSGLRPENWPVFSHINNGSTSIQVYYKAGATSQYTITHVASVGNPTYLHTQITYLVD